MAIHTIEHLQTITLMGIFLNTRDRADAAWSLLGAAIKVRRDQPRSHMFAVVDLAIISPDGSRHGVVETRCRAGFAAWRGTSGMESALGKLDQAGSRSTALVERE